MCQCVNLDLTAPLLCQHYSFCMLCFDLINVQVSRHTQRHLYTQHTLIQVWSQLFPVVSYCYTSLQLFKQGTSELLSTVSGSVTKS